MVTNSIYYLTGATSAGRSRSNSHQTHQQEIERLNKVAGMVGATQRILLCGIVAPFGNDQLTVSHSSNWLQKL